MLGYLLIALLGRFALLLVNVAVLAAGRLLVARTAGVAAARFPFRDGPLEAYERAPAWTRPAMVLVPPIGNYLCASLLFGASLLVGGKVVLTSRVNVIEGRPAADAGMRSGDRVVSIDRAPIDDWDTLARILADHPGEPLEVMVERDSAMITLQVTPVGPPSQGKIGVTPRDPPLRRPVGAGEALVSAAGTPLRVQIDALKGAATFLFGGTGSELTGPAAIVRETSRSGGKSPTADVLALMGAATAYAWPVFFLTALVTVPRRRRRKGPVPPP